ncbi:MAG: nucleotide exchange factor GrpE, partial [Chitinophagales bacterium]|nr:nucleotide exchange factor GrpE [Chitinophagales bacterium]
MSETEQNKDQEVKNQAEQDVETPVNEQENLPVDEGAVDDATTMVKELGEQKDKYIRLLAEFENYKRRTTKERLELFKTAGLEVIKDLLPALDDIDRAENAIASSKD